MEPPCNDKTLVFRQSEQTVPKKYGLLRVSKKSPLPRNDETLVFRQTVGRTESAPQSVAEVLSTKCGEILLWCTPWPYRCVRCNMCLHSASGMPRATGAEGVNAQRVRVTLWGYFLALLRAPCYDIYYEVVGELLFVAVFAEICRKIGGICIPKANINASLTYTPDSPPSDNPIRWLNQKQKRHLIPCCRIVKKILKKLFIFFDKWRKLWYTL